MATPTRPGGASLRHPGRPAFGYQQRFNAAGKEWLASLPKHEGAKVEFGEEQGFIDVAADDVAVLIATDEVTGYLGMEFLGKAPTSAQLWTMSVQLDEMARFSIRGRLVQQSQQMLVEQERTDFRKKIVKARPHLVG